MGETTSVLADVAVSRRTVLVLFTTAGGFALAGCGGPAATAEVGTIVLGTGFKDIFGQLCTYLGLEILKDGIEKLAAEAVQRVLPQAKPVSYDQSGGGAQKGSSAPSILYLEPAQQPAWMLLYIQKTQDSVNLQERAGLVFAQAAELLHKGGLPAEEVARRLLPVGPASSKGGSASASERNVTWQTAAGYVEIAHHPKRGTNPATEVIKVSPGHTWRFPLTGDDQHLDEGRRLGG